MNSIRTRLLRAFLLMILFFSASGIVFFVWNGYVASQYKSVSDNMIDESRLTDAVSQLIVAYNSRFLSNNIDEAVADKKITDIKTQIVDLTSHIDRQIVDPQSRVSFIGLNNNITDVVKEIDAGVALLQSGSVDNASIHYVAANKKYTFVKQNSATLLLDELRHSAKLQANIDKSYQAMTLIAITMLATMVLGTGIYAYRFAHRLVVPLTKLSNVAESISAGDLSVSIDKSLLNNTDEVGSLAQSFSIMLEKLKNYIEEINTEKSNVEMKVKERTAELVEEQTRLAASVNSLSLGFIMTDAQNNIMMMNNAARDVLSYKVNLDGISEPDPVDAIHDWTIDEIDTRMHGSFEFKKALVERISAMKPLERKEVEYNGRVLRFFLARILSHGNTSDQEELGSVILLEDITEAKVMERSKDEFFSIASHELRTPLTSIKGNSSMILDFYKDILKDPELKEMVEDVHLSAVRLIEIVNDFLDMSRLEQGKMTFKNEDFELEKVIESVIYETGSILKEKNLYIKHGIHTLSILPRVRSDADKVKQVIYNLVGNAIKFTETGGITIDAVPVKGFVKVTIADTGRGMDPEGQNLLFHKFQQTGSSLLTRDTTRGTGLGLYISKMFIEKMGGELKLVHSEAGKGSTFSFTLPIATNEKPISASPKSVTNSTTGLTATDPASGIKA